MIKIKNCSSDYIIEKRKLYAIGQSLADRVVMHFNLKTLYRVKQVCTDWNSAFTENSVSLRLKYFRLLHNPMFAKFVIGLRQIDMTNNEKFEMNKNRLGQYHVTTEKRIPQQKYESIMLSSAVLNAAPQNNRWVGSTLSLNHDEMTDLLEAADVLYVNYYGYQDIPKVQNADSNAIVKFAQNKYGFSGRERGLILNHQLSEEVIEKFFEKMENDRHNNAGFFFLKEFIIRNKIFPVIDRIDQKTFMSRLNTFIKRLFVLTALLCTLASIYPSSQKYVSITFMLYFFLGAYSL